jgi:Nucleotidyltransferase of unknown function (DUF6036)
MAGRTHYARTRKAGVLSGAAPLLDSMSALEVLRRITTGLEHAGIAYMLTGSFASAHHGAPRSTVDIDIVIAGDPNQLRAFVQSLPSNEYYVDLDTALDAHNRQSLFNVIDLVTGWKVDLIIRKCRAFSQEEFGRREVVKVQGFPLLVASAEDVVIAKLEWSKLAQSQRQIEDVAAIFRLRWETLDRRYLEKWISELNLKQEWTNAKHLAEISDGT